MSRMSANNPLDFIESEVTFNRCGCRFWGSDVKPYSQGKFGYLTRHRRCRWGHATVANAHFPGNGQLSQKEIEIISFCNSTITLDHVEVFSSQFWLEQNITRCGGTLLGLCMGCTVRLSVVKATWREAPKKQCTKNMLSKRPPGPKICSPWWAT